MMKRNFLPLVAIPALLAYSSVLGQRLAFAPAEGLILTKTFTSREDVSMDHMSTLVDGVDPAPGMPKMKLARRSSTTVVLVDEYGTIESGRPATLKRTYQTISAASKAELSLPPAKDLEIAIVGNSSLEGEVVLFSWSAEEGKYNIAFANVPPSRESLLEGLTENTDVRGVLPVQGVVEGDTWEVEPEILRGVLAFGGDLKLDMKVDGGGYLKMANFSDSSTHATPDKYLGDFKGTVSAVYGGMAEHEGQRVAIINLAIDVSTDKDMTEFWQENAPDPPVGTDWSTEINKANMAFEYKGNAVILWGVESGHMISLDMDVDTRASIEQELSMLRPNRKQTLVESTSRYSGSLSIAIRVEASER